MAVMGRIELYGRPGRLAGLIVSYRAESDVYECLVLICGLGLEDADILLLNDALCSFVFLLISLSHQMCSFLSLLILFLCLC